jgi:16S rRNA (guanine527-N7)-methyltransferase
MTLTAADSIRQLDAPLADATRLLGLSLKPEQVGQLLGYLVLLHRWNAVHNLSAAQDPKALLQQHLLDCVAAVPSLQRHASGRALRVLDAGTGAGLPAVVWALALPDWSVTAVDSVGKKVAFLRQVAGELGISNLRPLHARLETLSGEMGRFDVVTSRAFSSLRAFVTQTGHLVEPAGVWMAMKGKPTAAELSDLPPECELFHVEPLAVPGLDAQRCLVWLRPASTPPTVT